MASTKHEHIMGGMEALLPTEFSCRPAVRVGRWIPGWLECAGLENDRQHHGGIQIAGVDNKRLEFGRLEKDGLQIVELHGHWLW